MATERVSSDPGPALRSADFERALSSRPCARTEHFVLHHVSAHPAFAAELSTGAAQGGMPVVDERPRFGAVVPKRHARRSVTRNLVKREARAAFGRHLALMRPGDWLLRLRSPFPTDRFPSAASAPLRQVVRGELEALFAATAVRR